MLHVPYYHLVFTLPEELDKVCLYKPKVIYSLLFKTSWSVISHFASNTKFLGAKTEMVAILHIPILGTGYGGKTLSLHPHLHCIVPGGGVSPQMKWKHARQVPVPGKSNVKGVPCPFCGRLAKTNRVGRWVVQKTF